MATATRNRLLAGLLVFLTVVGVGAPAFAQATEGVRGTIAAEGVTEEARLGARSTLDVLDAQQEAGATDPAHQNRDLHIDRP